MEYLQDATSICLSGGAPGADVEWGNCASRLGHKVIHWSFASHEECATMDHVVLLNDEQLKQGDTAIEAAAKAQGKRSPSRTHVARLIKRIYYQVAWAESCYAVTSLQAGPGGTTWATTMFTQLHPGNHKLYVFDQNQGAWLQSSESGMVLIDSPPQPTGRWAGIGSRDLRENGRAAIRKLMGAD